MNIRADVLNIEFTVIFMLFIHDRKSRDEYTFNYTVKHNLIEIMRIIRKNEARSDQGKTTKHFIGVL